VTLCLALFAGAADALTVEEESVAVDLRDGLYTGTLQLQLPVAERVARAVLTDFDNMARFMPGLRSSRIVARDGNAWHVAQEGRADFGPFALPFQSERRVELMADGSLVATAISGSTRHMRSVLRLHATGPASVQLDYRIEMIPAMWIPGSVGVAFLRHELADQFTALSAEMERRQRQNPR
jgi:hypothetical protein